MAMETRVFGRTGMGLSVLGFGCGAVGTPDACAAQIERLWQQSSGGFGAYLLLAHNWANPSATFRSYELIAQATLDAARRAQGLRVGLAAAQSQAVEDARTRYPAPR
jgi:limonene 1,2-monooxygenase